MINVPLFLLSDEGNRSRAAWVLGRATGLPEVAAHTMVLTLDGVCAAALRTAGVSNEDSRRVLTELWHPQRPSERPPLRGPDPRPGVAGRDRAFLRTLGERIHTVRCARQVTLNQLWGRTGIEVHLLRDIEAGDLTPTLIGLRRIGEALHAPLTLLVDESASPLAILERLSA